MEPHEYAVIYRAGGVRFECTNPKVIDEVLSELMPVLAKNRIRNPKVEFSATGIFLSGQRVSVRISRLNDKDIGVMWWILNYLLQRGWEIFEATTSPSFHLRR